MKTMIEQSKNRPMTATEALCEKLAERRMKAIKKLLIKTIKITCEIHGIKPNFRKNKRVLKRLKNEIGCTLGK